MTSFDAEFLGWMAAALMLATFSCKDARRMRPLAVTCNLAFIAYGLSASLAPVTVLHLVLLPINVWRWVECSRGPASLTGASSLIGDQRPGRAATVQLAVQPAGVRSHRERLIQTLWFEGIGLLTVAPLYAWASGSSGSDAFVVVASVSLAVMVWAALYNTVFDRIEYRCTARVASDRPHALRTVHAVGLEISSTLVTTPLIWALTDLGWWGALAADLGLGVAYALYSYLFHWAYDRARPVGATALQ